MKKTYIFLLLAIMTLGAKAQILNGDLDGDNKLTKNDVDLLVKDVLTGNKRNMKSDVYNPFITDQMFISGCWWTDKYNYIEFKPSGINCEGKDYKYEYFPFLGHILLYDEYDYPVKAIYVMDKDAESLTLRTSGSNVMTKYYRNKPVYLVQSINFEESSVNLLIRESKDLKVTVLPEDADNSGLIWTSSDESVVKVTEDGKITGVSAGSARITVSAVDGSGVKGSCSIYVKNYIGSHRYVDLGLSVMWADDNVGEGYKGDYFAWGETETKSNFTWDTYKWSENGNNNISLKYNSEHMTLDPEDDAATKAWGDPWRMPTAEEVQELIDNCTWEIARDDNGYPELFRGTSKINGTIIEFHCRGSYEGDDNILFFFGYYWTSSLAESLRPYQLFLGEYGNLYIKLEDSSEACYGQTIRPVYKPK